MTDADLAERTDIMALKALYGPFARAMSRADPGGWRQAATALFASDAAISVVHPFNDLAGPDAYLDRVLAPFAASFDHLHRRDDILLTGHFEGDDWIAATGHYAGHFARPWIGIPATGALAFLRFAEFHRVREGRVVESFIYLDLPALMIAAGAWPIAEAPGRDRGYTGYLPGPATKDGLSFPSDPVEGARTFRIVMEMLAGLATEDESWRPYWHDDMFWHGPAAFGAFIGIENFAAFQRPFELAFEDWAGGAAGSGRTRHFTRFADGPYACLGGWPSLSGTQIAPFMGQPATGKMLYMRVCDFWRRDGDKLAENWVFVDIPHVLTQMGVDLFEGVAT